MDPSFRSVKVFAFPAACQSQPPQRKPTGRRMGKREGPAGKEADDGRSKSEEPASVARRPHSDHPLSLARQMRFTSESGLHRHADLEHPIRAEAADPAAETRPGYGLDMIEIHHRFVFQALHLPDRNLASEFPGSWR